MKILLSFLVISVVMFSCSGNSEKRPDAKKSIDQHFLDSVISNSDSTYEKPYKRLDFVTAVYYINKIDSTVSQLMKDSAEKIRQFSIAKNNVRIYFVEFYPNGQVKADLRFDEFGQNHKAAKYYYENGKVESEGVYDHGLKTGEWKNYNEEGNVISIDTYDTNGQVIQRESK